MLELKACLVLQPLGLLFAGSFGWFGGRQQWVMLVSASYCLLAQSDLWQPATEHEQVPALILDPEVLL